MAMSMVWPLAWVACVGWFRAGFCVFGWVIAVVLGTVGCCSCSVWCFGVVCLGFVSLDFCGWVQYKCGCCGGLMIVGLGSWGFGLLRGFVVYYLGGVDFVWFVRSLVGCLVLFVLRIWTWFRLVF